jgi:quercetin dioxygenase-like cupin family protein
MAIPHAQPGEMIDVRPLGQGLASAGTHTLVKSSAIEVIRLVLPAGKDIPQHIAPGDITLQCLEGRVELTVAGHPLQMTPGSMVHLLSSQAHSLRAEDDASLLLTIVLDPKAAPDNLE